MSGATPSSTVIVARLFAFPVNENGAPSVALRALEGRLRMVNE
jgi:hypothetical protein